MDREMQLPRLARQVVAFGIVGSVGFVVDASILTILTAFFGFGPFGGRALSFLAAVMVTWWLNRTFTFHTCHVGSPDQARPVACEVMAYLSAQFLGILINLGIYVFLVSSYSLFNAFPAIAVAAGSVAAMTFNFAAARLIVFRR